MVGTTAGEFDKLTKAAAESGRVFSEDQVDREQRKQALAVEDAKDAIGGLVGELTIALLPIVEKRFSVHHGHARACHSRRRPDPRIRGVDRMGEGCR